MPDHDERCTDRPVRPTVVVLGAGINGAALARELVLSDVSVIVVDADDIACGATAWSTRLIHGGLRYLEYGEVGLVRESLVERDRLARLAPHLVRRLSFYVPVRGRWGGLWAAAARLVGWESLARRWRGTRGRGSWTLGIGLTLYDLLSAGSGWPWHRTVRAGGPGLPHVDRQAYPLAATYADGQSLYPERLAVEFLIDARRIAAERGTAFAVHTRHRARLEPDGRLHVGPIDGEAGVAFTIDPAAIVNATGAWVDRTQHDVFAAVAPAGSGPLIGGTKGSHLVMRSAALRASLGDYGVYAEADDGRPIFVLPFGADLVLVGTTDIPYHGDPALARADDDEIDYLLAAVRRLFPVAGMARADVQQHYSGVRPLPASGDGATGSPGHTGSPGSITRRHLLVRHPQCIVPAWSIVGGKLTTCRSLAESATAEVLRAIGVAVTGESRERPLPGAWSGDGRDRTIAATRAAAEAAGIAVAESGGVAERLVTVFGTRAAEIFSAAGRCRSGLIRDVGLPVAVVDFCGRQEWARTIADLVERRLMLVFDPALSLAAITDIAAALVDTGMLPASEQAAAVAAYASRLRDHFGRHLGRHLGDTT